MSAWLRQNPGVKHFIAEFFGTFMIVWLGCGSIMVAERFPGTFSGPSISAMFGGVVAVMVYLLGPVSGAHMNPAVTIAFAVGRHFPTRHVALYLTAQFAGAAAATAILHGILPPGLSYGATVPTVGVAAAVCLEALLTFILMFVVLAIATDRRVVVTMPATVIGVVVGLEALFAGPVTGASMNPARSFGPALFQSGVATLWVYFVGPIVGAVAASWSYDLIRSSKTQDTTTQVLPS